MKCMGKRKKCSYHNQSFVFLTGHGTNNTRILAGWRRMAIRMHKEGRSMLRTIMRFLLLTLAVIFTTIQAIAINLGTAAPLPGILPRIAAWPWWFVGLASLGLVALAISDWRLTQGLLDRSFVETYQQTA
jgi:hypothetical protein